MNWYKYTIHLDHLTTHDEYSSSFAVVTESQIYEAHKKTENDDELGCLMGF